MFRGEPRRSPPAHTRTEEEQWRAPTSCRFARDHVEVLDQPPSPQFPHRSIRFPVAAKVAGGERPPPARAFSFERDRFFSAASRPEAVRENNYRRWFIASRPTVNATQFLSVRRLQFQFFSPSLLHSPFLLSCAPLRSRHRAY